jgi:hypothetical protein
MKTSTQSALIVAGFLIAPVLLVLLAKFLYIIIITTTFSLSLGLVTYYGYIEIKAELDWKKSEFERLTHGFDSEKLRFYKFFKNYFDTYHEK